MRAQALTELHGISQKYAMGTCNYITEILESFLLYSLARTSSTGSVREKKMVPGMSFSVPLTRRRARIYVQRG